MGKRVDGIIRQRDMFWPCLTSWMVQNIIERRELDSVIFVVLVHHVFYLPLYSFETMSSLFISNMTPSELCSAL